jgi:hypothetical protein
MRVLLTSLSWLLAAALLVQVQGIPALAGQGADTPEDIQQVVAPPTSTPLLKGHITYCLPSGTPIKLKLATVPTSGLKLLDRDMDGNLLPAQLNQEISARTSEDIYVDEHKVIPAGTVFHGRVSKIFPPRRVGRPGSLVLSFDEFRTPDGRRFAFRAEANNYKPSTMKTKLKGAGLIAAHSFGGAVVGVLVAYQLFGMTNTVALHGYNIAGGAAAGALMGTAVALMRHGPEAVLEPGDDLNMAIDTDLLIPAATAPTFQPPPITQPGLAIEVQKSKVVKDGLGGHQLQVQLFVENNTKKRLRSIDLYMEDANGNRYPLVADSDQERSEFLFTVEPHSFRQVTCDFTVDYPKLKRKLIWLDHDTRAIIAEQKLP